MSIFPLPPHLPTHTEKSICVGKINWDILLVTFHRAAEALLAYLQNFDSANKWRTVPLVPFAVLCLKSIFQFHSVKSKSIFILLSSIKVYIINILKWYSLQLLYYMPIWEGESNHLLIVYLLRDWHVKPENHALVIDCLTLEVSLSYSKF